MRLHPKTIASPKALPFTKSPLRYPGGKSRAVKQVLALLPRGLDLLCSPFLGGASIELACAGRGIAVRGYDSFQPLVAFWQCLQPLRAGSAGCAIPSACTRFMPCKKIASLRESQACGGLLCAGLQRHNAVWGIPPTFHQIKHRTHKALCGCRFPSEAHGF